MNNKFEIIICILLFLFVKPQHIGAQELAKSDSISIDNVNATRMVYYEIRNLNNTLKAISEDTLKNSILSKELSKLNENINIMVNKPETKVVENPASENKNSNWQFWVPVLISISAFVIAFFANQIARDSNSLSIQANTLANHANEIYTNELNLTHRPYVWVENFSYLNQDQILVPDLGTIMLIVINSPAKLVSETHSHYGIKDGDQNEIENSKYETRILYPSDKTQSTYSIGKEQQNKIIELSSKGFDIFRESKLKYKMLSGNEEYYYEAKWKLDYLNKKWNLVKNPNAN